MSITKTKRTQSRPVAEYKEDLKQNWLTNSYSRNHSDQFGFVIEYGRNYKLFWKEILITQTHSLTAAKEISLILLNDKIMHG